MKLLSTVSFLIYVCSNLLFFCLLMWDLISLLLFGILVMLMFTFAYLFSCVLRVYLSFFPFIDFVGAVWLCLDSCQGLIFGGVSAVFFVSARYYEFTTFKWHSWRVSRTVNLHTHAICSYVFL